MRFTEWSDELAAELAAPFAKELHMQKDRRGTFVSVHHYVRRLNELVGPQGWSMCAPIPFTSGAKQGLAVGVTVLGVTKWNVGDEMEDHGEPVTYTDDRGEEREKVVDFGSSSTNSWAQSFKRCMAYGFGMGLYMYDKEFTKQLLNGRATYPGIDAAKQNAGNASPARNTQSQNAPPQNTGTTNDATDKQKALIDKLAQSSAVSQDTVRALLADMADGLSRRQASDWIERLNGEIKQDRVLTA